MTGNDPKSDPLPPETAAGWTNWFAKEVSTKDFWLTVSTVIGGFAALIGVYIAILSAIDRAVDARVDERMQPHLWLTSAILADRNDDPWAIVDSLREVVQVCELDTFGDIALDDGRRRINACIGPANFEIFLDYLITGIVESPTETFARFEGDLSSIFESFGPQVDEVAWRLLMKGKFELRRGNTETAEAALTKSKAKYLRVNGHRERAWPRFFLGVSLAARNEFEAAVHEIAAAIDCSPREIRGYVAEGEAQAIMRETFWADVASSSPELDDSLRTVFESVRSDQRPKVNCAEELAGG